MDEMSSVTSSSHNTPKLNRSCEQCRVRKIRCHVSDVPGGSKCTRCTQRGFPCIFVPASKRRRKRTDVRIKELERKVESLLPLARRTSCDVAEEGEFVIASSLSGATLSSSKSRQSGGPPKSGSQEGTDVIDSGMVDISKAAELYRCFNEELSPHYPAIFISLSTSLEHMRTQRPSLFLSIIAAAAASLGLDIAPGLNQEVEKSHARCVLIDGERSLDLAQGLLVSAIWNYPPDKFQSLKFSRYAQMAADVVMDLSLPQELDQYLPSDGGPSISHFGSENELLEKCRTLVACFLLRSR